MERKVGRRGPNLDHLPLDKSMISAPTNFSHVVRCDPFRDRLGEWEETDDRGVGGGGVKDCSSCPVEANQEVVQGVREADEGEGQRQEGRQGGEYEVSPLSPPSPNTDRRNSRKISKDMISLPLNFRHVLHIDPSSADPAHLSLLLKSGTELEYDLECEEEDDQDDPAWPPPEPPIDYQESAKGPPLPDPSKATKPNRPSSRVRKSMISLPTNFQHVNHISAGERLHDADSPPPQVPPEPGLGEEGEGGHKAAWEYKEHTTTPFTPPITPYTTPSTPPITPYTTAPTYTASNAPYNASNAPYTAFNTATNTPYISNAPYSPTTTPYTSSNSPYTTTLNLHTPPSPHYATPATHHSPIPPPLTLPTSEASHTPAPLSAPPHLDTTRAKSHLLVGGQDQDQDQDRVRFRGGDTGFDFDIVQFRVPPPPPDPSGSDAIRSSLQSRPRTYHQLMEEEARREEEKDDDEEEERAEKTWRRNERGLTWRDRCQEEARRPSPLDAPPPPPFAPPAASRRRSIGRPTNFQHVRHLNAETADRLLEECVEEGATRNGEKIRGRERESERARERRTPSLPPSLPHSSPTQDPPSTGKLRKPVIGHPTNFQHVAHVGFGGVHGVN